MKKLIAGALLISGVTLAAGTAFADGHDDRGYGRSEEAHDRDHDRDHRLKVFGWKLPVSWDFDDDDDDDDDDDHHGTRAAAPTPTGPINNNKLITKGATPKVSIN